MKLLVCMKQVPDMESKFQIDGNGTWYSLEDLAWRMNEYDEYSVEQAVLIKEQLGDVDVTVLSIGSDKVKETMKKALAMGCDRGVHIDDANVFTREPYEIAGIIAEFAKDKGFDVILTGMQSQDRGSGQVGLLVAEMLDIASVSTIVSCCCTSEDVEVARELEGGIKAKIKVKLPALLTCQLGLNVPRYPTLPNIMKAKKKELLTLPGEDFLQVAPRMTTEAMFIPEKKAGGIILEGDENELADKLIAILKEKTAVL
ncbi:electron transfer flavoprotein subunit beta/FixA family protein [Desulforhopalus singaporensis]|uniref:Electron transfer flavoprotein subunit beta n=1 Tax=Desulforhopalus singaporensis TaxID=91360 RepID=A0A1H0P0L3_9BACT|nr:electron transfer flavoprotein subunit beta/FixA family protein [Desulforhopalus singaporensis]SDO98288.1 electron transfer flavoprotein beta subunit [Desulforhopalus singaporensis]